MHFHFAGLGGAGNAGNDSTRRHRISRNAYGRVHSSRLLTLQQMVSANGGASPDVLKLDCEGCEWEALAQIAREVPSLLSQTRMLFLEAHVSRSLVPPTVTMETFVTVWEYLMLDLGFRMWYLRDNPGYKFDKAVVPFLNGTASGLKRSQCCYEMAFVRGVPGRMRNVTGIRRAGLRQRRAPPPVLARVRGGGGADNIG